MNSYLTAIGTANPQYKIAQNDVIDFMVKAHGLNEQESNKLQALYRATGIKSRYSAIADYQSSSNNHFFPDNDSLEPFPSTKKRMDFYKKESVKLSLEAINNALGTRTDFELSKISHLITVSCTGMFAPGLDIQLISHLGLDTRIKRMAINFMGCYAAFNAIKAADAICRSTADAVVLVVCTEMCSLHFQKEKTEDNLLANALFGDGSAALIMQSHPACGINLQPTSFYCDLLKNGEEEMAWEIGDFGFEMKLSAYVPDVIASGIAPLIKGLRNQISKIQFDKYAIHPGGKKIIRVIEDELGIDPEQNKESREVLEQYGNMSSPTIIFVLQKIWQSLRAEDDQQNILSLAFGPGLTLESMILNVVYN